MSPMSPTIHFLQAKGSQRQPQTAATRGRISSGKRWRAKGISFQDGGVTVIEKCPWFETASRRKRWLVGVSGGADSVALLHLLVAAGFGKLVVCHLDHGLRGRESAEDARFVKRLAAKLGVECESGQADVKTRMSERRESMETAARHARHVFFARCARKYRCKQILLAHHADDQAETVLWNLLRGSHGLKGMRGKQLLTTESGKVLEFHRPLFGVRRAELADWLKSRKLRWREDASNAEPVALRNRLRNEALPLLVEISGRDAALAFARAASDAEETEVLVTWALDKARVLDPQGRLHLGALKELPSALQSAAIVRFLKDAGVGEISRELISKALNLCDPRNQAVLNLPGGAFLRRRSGRLFI